MKDGNPKVAEPDLPSTALMRALVQLRVARERLDRMGATTHLAALDAVRGEVATLYAAIRDVRL